MHADAWRAGHRRLTPNRTETHTIEEDRCRSRLQAWGGSGAGMARRLARNGHDVVAWNRTAAGGHRPRGGAGERRPRHGRRPARGDRGAAWPRRGTSSSASPPATPPTSWSSSWPAILSPGDVIVDAGNSNFHDSQRRAAELEARGLEFLDMGVSGGIWGLQVGFCAMVGGKREVFDRFEPAVRDRSPRRAATCTAARPARGTT